MAHLQNTVQKRNFKHLTSFERGMISALHKEGHSNRGIARRLGRAHQAIANELKCGTTTQLKTGRNPYTAYFPETGQAVYEQNRKFVVPKVNCGKIMNQGWSPNAVVGFSKQQNDWKDKPMVSTKTLRCGTSHPNFRSSISIYTSKIIRFF
ncbi:helix-turn-helix domain-containing protein [Sporosarcina limicola]|uniref:IS30 family transposase n=1 Tax=Sporosarcina limicola TaxID=34101 RepID=A0A927R7H7_9BACL|nr:helix-turn-helix domain-containing protein [Sporosarcina limicola]MBE1556004.1 IS30 family transposase [Sporosarcina limicola]